MKTVLLIDYDPGTLERHRAMLIDGGYHTLEARDAASGVASFIRDEPDLAVIQDLMPKWHGLEICRDLKNTPHGRRTPIMLLMNSGSSHIKEVTTARCDDHLVKPVDADDFLEKFRTLLETAANRRDAGIAVVAAPKEIPAGVEPAGDKPARTNPAKAKKRGKKTAKAKTSRSKPKRAKRKPTKKAKSRRRTATT